jgi:hypothetical protein
MLTCTTSFTLHKTMDVTIHNQHPNIDLAVLVYFCDGGTYNERPVERMDIDAMINIGFQFGLDKLPYGILMCQVQKNGNTMSDHQPNADTTSTKAVEDTSKMMQLLVTWKIERFREPKVHIVLVEHDSKLVLDEDKLARLYDKIDDWFSRHYSTSKSTWLVCDNIVLEASVEVHEEDLELKIIISEGVRNTDNMKPMWIDSTRQVLFPMIIYFVLIYIISCTLQSAMDVTINNQCSNIELTSPVYFIKDTACHIHLPQQVDSESRMKVDFMIGVDRDLFGGVLLYHLQRKESVESDHRFDTDTSTSTQFLIIWGCSSDEVYSHVWLIKHERTFIWSEDKLEKLCHVYDSQYRTYSNIDRRRWLLYDNTMLKIECETTYRGFKMEVIISEDKHLFLPQKSLWIDPNR